MPCVVHLLRLKCSAQAEGDPATLRMRPNLFPHDRGYCGYSPEQMGLGLASHALLAERRCTGLQASLVVAGRGDRSLGEFFAGKPEARSRYPLPRTGRGIEKKERG